MAGPDAGAVPLVEVWRGSMCESVHRGHAVVVDRTGEVVSAWGDPGAVIYPRSSCKMIQALPLVESGAADVLGLGDRHLALACASHQGAASHVALARDWLAALGMEDGDLRCGPEEPRDRAERNALIRSGEAVCQMHNNCSGKHCGFLTVSRHLGAGAEYVDPGHPVQAAVREAFETMTGLRSPGFGIDGCSAPNFATTLQGLGRAMARFAAARDGGVSVRERAAARLVRAMLAHPDLVAGEGRACTALMRTMGGKVAVKTGAEGVFIAILPEQGLGVAMKCADGATRAAEAVVAAILVRLGVLEAEHPVAARLMRGPITNRRGLSVGEIRVAAALAD
jgi:L-asparaginase II